MKWAPGDMTMRVPTSNAVRYRQLWRWRHGLTAAFLVMTVPGIAASLWQTSTVKQVHPLPVGAFIVVLDTDPPTCAARGPGKYLYLMNGQNDVTEEGRKQFVAALPQAVATRAAVSINFDDATPYCYINRLVLNPP